jgi:hypothetical protein
MHFLDNKIAPNKPGTSVPVHRGRPPVAKRYQQPRWGLREAIHHHIWPFLDTGFHFLVWIGEAQGDGGGGVPLPPAPLPGSTGPS